MPSKTKKTARKSTTKKAATKKAATKKTTTRRKASSVKASAAKKTTAKKKATKKAATPRRKKATGGSLLAVTSEQRQQMIAEAAYFKAEHRGFMPGDTTADWFDAEREVDAALAVRSTGSTRARA